MKIRLLENVTDVGLKGQEVEVDDKSAVDLEKRGYAEFVGDAPVLEEEAAAEQEQAPAKAKKAKR